jgi:hypothetical protein
LSVLKRVHKSCSAGRPTVQIGFIDVVGASEHIREHNQLGLAVASVR